MQVLTKAPIPLKLLGAVLALGILAAAVLAVALTASTTQAQSPGAGYDDPQPCGPGAATAYQPEPHEVTEGHFALFDGYWQRLDQHGDSVGILHTNLCPPLVVQTTQFNPETEEEETVTSLAASGIDVDEAIIHVTDRYRATVVEGDPNDANTGQFPLGQFAKRPEGHDLEAGNQVWWLRLDDPSTGEDETSDLSLGFSTMRFDEEYWAAPDGYPPFRFKFELQRNPGIDAEDHPHFFAYRAFQGGEAELVWNSAEADTGDMMMEAGQLEDLQWVFTQPGTYELWVHLQGWVRQEDNRLASFGPDWQPISEHETETSEVKRYVIQVGSALDEVEPPQFGVYRSVAENSPLGASVGDPIHVLLTDVDDLEYRLSGEGSDLFVPVPGISATEGHLVQIVVANGAQLDYETQRVYDLTLGVTDNLDHESNYDPSLDDTLAVRISLEDVPASATIRVDNAAPRVGETVTFTAELTDILEGSEFVDFEFRDSNGGSSTAPNYVLQRNVPTEVTVYLTVTYQREADSDPVSVYAEPITVNWRSQ